MKAIPQVIFIALLVVNFITSLVDKNRNSKASLIATIILLALTYWGGFYRPLFEFIADFLAPTI